MRFPLVSRCILQAAFACLIGWTGSVCCAAEGNDEKILSNAEIAAMDRENGMWHRVRVEDEVAANLQTWRKAGYTADEVTALQPRLSALWQVAAERNFGWLHEDTASRIKDVDREFIARMRAVRLYEATGVRAGIYPLASVATVNRMWRQAILHILEYDEIAEFRLMNSIVAREEARRVEGLTLTEDELRTLFVWRREYDGWHVPSQPDAGLSAAQQETRMDQWRRIRDLLGDERFVRYLERDHPGFEHMRRALEKSGVTGASVALDLWWLRQREGYAKNQELRGALRDELTAAMRVKATDLIGEAPLADYLKDEDARWLVIRGIQRRPAVIGVRKPREGSFDAPVQQPDTP